MLYILPSTVGKKKKKKRERKKKTQPKLIPSIYIQLRLASKIQDSAIHSFLWFQEKSCSSGKKVTQGWDATRAEGEAMIKRRVWGRRERRAEIQDYKTQAGLALTWQLPPQGPAACTNWLGSVPSATQRWDERGLQLTASPCPWGRRGQHLKYARDERGARAQLSSPRPIPRYWLAYLGIISRYEHPCKISYKPKSLQSCSLQAVSWWGVLPSALHLASTRVGYQDGWQQSHTALGGPRLPTGTSCQRRQPAGPCQPTLCAPRQSLRWNPAWDTQDFGSTA